MEPDKTYPLHSDDASQSPPSSSSLPTSEQEKTLEAPSVYNQPRKDGSSQSPAVPWYLRPLTKSNDTALTSPQTRPFIPRQSSTLAGQGSPIGMPSAPRNVEQTQEPSSASGQSSSSQARSKFAQSTPRSASNIQPLPLSPFRSQAIAYPLSQQPHGQPESLTSGDRFQMPGQTKAPEYRQALATASPRPFSQFGNQPAKQSIEKKSRQPNLFRKISGIALAILLVVGIGAGAYWLWQRANIPSATVSPTAVADIDDRLYRAIENNLNTSNVHQVYEQTTVARQTSTVKIDAVSNFSDPRTPKSYLTYEVKAGDDEVAVQAAGEIVVPGADEYYAKLTKPVLFYNGVAGLEPAENQWYAVPSTDTKSEVLMDPLGVRKSVNSSLGEFPVGNFSEDMRKQLMQYVKEKKVYEVTTSQQVEIDGKKMTNYKLRLNTDALKEFNRKVFVASGGTADNLPIEFTKSDKENIEIWISNDVAKISKIMIERESTSDEYGDGVKMMTVVSVDYPDDVSKINKPESAKVPTW